MDEMDREIPIHASAPSGTMLASPASFAHGLEAESLPHPEESDAIELNEVVSLEGEEAGSQRVQRARPRTLFGTGLGPSDKEIVMPKSRERIEALRRKMFKTDTPEDLDDQVVTTTPHPQGPRVPESKGNSTILLSDAIESDRMVMASSVEMSPRAPRGEDLFCRGAGGSQRGKPQAPPPTQTRPLHVL